MITKKQKAIVEKYVKELMEISNFYSDDKEVAHSKADDAILGALIELGFPEIVDVYDKVVRDCGGFWYA